jgi:YggT family protein
VFTILYEIVNEILSLYIWAVILAAVFSMLVAFGVLDTRNRIVWTIGDFLYRLTEPALRPIRNFLPNFGSLDLSPIVLIFLIWIIQQMLQRIFVCIAFSACSQLLF